MTIQAETAAPRAVIVVSSHVARGSVGNRAAVFALETLGHPVWAVPTVMLPWHPGHGRATRIVPPTEQFSAFMADLERAPWLGEVTAVLSGYLGEAGQVEAVASLVETVKARNPKALYVCDPVIGDSGGLYVAEALASGIRDRLLPLADIATPNRYELEWLTGTKLDDMRATMAAALAAPPPTMLVTSAPAMMAGGTGNLLVTQTQALLAEHRTVERPPNGLGDLSAAVFLARLLAGQPAAKALQSTTASVYEILARTSKRGGDELQLETDAQSLSHPMAMVELRTLIHPSRSRKA
ncbi:Pyridoxamine kinase [Aminobacter sp. MSH1]|uniref:pyridoxal kinase n=1 Tax=Aminobacter niigataensis TaxID=83265 RepID=A0ABR6L3W3_9HYPH|nr:MULTISPECIES: pyridoxal kinase PdxY [Aminobacter]AWC21724.1 Pyridoxamine kinase [Aminobacter sp. MSH1]MBB4650864.1 pyridoxine kinase [Aminobacter niigataensis]